MRTDDRTEEQILVMRAQRGEQDAFRVLVERYQKLVYTLALRMLNVPADAEDAAQEAFLSAWKALPRFRMDAKFSTWLYRLTVNAATDVLRRRRKEPDSLDDAERPVLVRRAIGALSENHRQILLLREVTGLSYEEIGAALELSPGTVRSRLARARKELREELLAEGNYFDLPPSKGEKGR